MGARPMCPELIRTRGYRQTMNHFTHTHLHTHTHTHTYLLIPGLLQYLWVYFNAYWKKNTASTLNL